MLFLLQFHQPLMYILPVSGAISAILREWVDFGVIFAVVLVNAVIGFIQGSQRPQTHRSAFPQSQLVRHRPCAATLGNTPMWIFHGVKASIVPIEFSRQMANAWQARGCPVLYTEFSQEDHGIWDKAYDDEDLCAWLFARGPT